MTTREDIFGGLSIEEVAKMLAGEHMSQDAGIREVYWALEKLSKAALLRSGRATVPKVTSSHLGAVEQLERAQPQLAHQGPCLEYPWEAPGGIIRWPAAHLPLLDEFRPKRQGGIMVLRFASALCDRFDDVFP